MYAIIQSGGKQYKVKQGDEVDVELLHVEDGSTVEFKEVLFIGGDSVKVGSPAVQNAIVRGEVLGTAKGPKVTFVKYRPSHNERRKHGHRQKYSRVKITEIQNAK